VDLNYSYSKGIIQARMVSKVTVSIKKLLLRAKYGIGSNVVKFVPTMISVSIVASMLCCNDRGVPGSYVKNRDREKWTGP
jgi:hypothetical protein